MTIKDKIEEQLRNGHGLKLDGSDFLIRHAGRKEAQERADAPRLAQLEAEKESKRKEKEAAAAALALLVDPGPLPETPTELQIQARAKFEREKAFHERDRNQAAAKEKDAIDQAAKIKATQATLGPVRQYKQGQGKKALLRDIMRWVEKRAGSDACRQCAQVLDDYLTANPGALLVKINDYDGAAASIADANTGQIIGYSVSGFRGASL